MIAHHGRDESSSNESDPPARGARSSLIAETVPSPFGPILAAATDAGVCLLEFDAARARRGLEELSRRLNADPAAPASAEARGHLAQLREELRQYFAGKSLKFSCPLVTVGTEFEKGVWDRLLAIPAGQTRSYGQLAAALGQPMGARAVGRANGRNRIAIVIPCHRVIETGGGLGGYGGGLERKRWLLDHERQHAGGALFVVDPLPDEIRHV